MNNSVTFPGIPPIPYEYILGPPVSEGRFFGIIKTPCLLSALNMAESFCNEPLQTLGSDISCFPIAAV